MTFHQLLLKGSGFANTVASIEPAAINHSLEPCNLAHTPLVLFPFPLGIALATCNTLLDIAFIDQAGLLAALFILLAGSVILRNTVNNRHRFFQTDGSCLDLCKKGATVFTSFLVPLVFALGIIAVYLYYLGLALGDVLLLTPEGYKSNMDSANLALIVFFFQLAAMIFHPIINGIDFVGSVAVTCSNSQLFAINGP